MSSTTTPLDGGIRVERLPRVGARYEIATRGGHRLSVAIDPRGDRHIQLVTDGPSTPGQPIVLSAGQSSLLALILSGALDGGSGGGIRVDSSEL
jgi:hypothetical protein